MCGLYVLPARIVCATMMFMENRNNSLPAGSVLRSQTAEYEILKVLGAGGFGITYLASTKMSVGNIPVTFKVAVKEHFPKADCERRSDSQEIVYSAPAAERYQGSCRNFLAEARRLQQIASAHDNIVRVNEVFEANGTAYYVMEYLEGRSLSTLIAAEGPMSQQRMLDVMRPIIGATAFLHSGSVTHLDIKPDNIMVVPASDNQPERPVLIDFGLSKHYNPDGTATSSVGLRGVSDGFTPIEQYAGLSKFSPASDVYSLAATMLFCLTGKILPAAAEVTADTFDAYMSDDISADLRDVLVRSLSFRIAERPGNAGELSRELDRIIAATPSAAGSITEEIPVSAEVGAAMETEQQPVAPEKPEETEDIEQLSEQEKNTEIASPEDYEKTEILTTPSYTPIPLTPTSATIASVPDADPQVSHEPVSPVYVPIGIGVHPNPVAPHEMPAPPMPTDPPATPPAPPADNGSDVSVKAVTDSRPVALVDPEERKPAGKKAMLWTAVILLIVAAGAGAWWFLNRPYEVDMDDIGEEKNIEDVAAETSTEYDEYSSADENYFGSVEQIDSAAAEYSRAYYDMRFNELVPGSGVRTMVWNGITFEFDRDGNWINDEYYEPVLGSRSWGFDGNKRQYEYYTGTGSNESGYMVHYWDYDNNVYMMVDPVRGFTVTRSFGYDGRILSQTTSYDSGKPSKELNFSYTDDSHGNWVRRSDGTRREITYY